MLVEMAHSTDVPGKFKVRLACGHEYLCDCSVSEPKTHLPCPVCEGVGDSESESQSN